MFWLTLLFRWMHILGAIALVGSALFYWRAIWPSMSDLPENQRKERFQAIRPHWARLVMLSILLLLVSGFANIAIMSKSDEFKAVTGWYHGLLGIKILLALLVFYLMSLITGRSKLAGRLRQNSPLWISLTSMLAVVVVLLAGVMKVTPRNTSAKNHVDVLPVVVAEPESSGTVE